MGHYSHYRDSFPAVTSRRNGFAMRQKAEPFRPSSGHPKVLGIGVTARLVYRYEPFRRRCSATLALLPAFSMARVAVSMLARTGSISRRA